MTRPHLARLLLLAGILIVLAAGLLSSQAARSAAPASELRVTVADPVGDTQGVSPLHDIVSLSATLEGNSIALSVAFSDTISYPGSGLPDAIYGFLDLDTDQDPGTGNTSHVTTQCDDGSGLGMDYSIDLSSYNT